jgi:hypothetical protein
LYQGRIPIHRPPAENVQTPDVGGFADGVVQISTKSGSTEFHGSAYEYSLRVEAGQKTGDDFLTRTDISS